MTDQISVEFPTPEDLGHRDWGSETLLALVPGKYSLKRLDIKAGHKGGLQYHHLKDECGYLVSGKLIIRYDSGDSELREKVVEAGAAYHFQPGVVHQTEAVTDCVILEASTPHFNDRVRVEAEYGLVDEGGLPSVPIEDVKCR